MNERVRVYELARKMNIPNEDVITTLRELGYDIKSHSSTVDSQAMNLLITALNKKKQQQQPEKAKAVKTKPADPTTKTTKTAKATKAAPVPQAPIVKPRVLSRYRPVPIGEGESATGTPLLTNIPTVTPTVPVTPTPIPTQPALAAHTQKVIEHAAAPIKVQPKQPEVIVEPPLEHKVVAIPIEPAQEQIPIHAKEIQEEKSAKPVIENPPAIETEKPHVEETEREEIDTLSIHGHAMRPMSPSVPVRVAAPSMRATPPRPPKSHRQTPAERHIQKKEEKARPVAAVTVEVPKIVALTANLTVQELAEKMNISETEIIKNLFMKGHMRTVNQMVELELAKELAREMEYEILTEEIPSVAETLEEPISEEEQSALVARPPVVTIMGHVDHGKTSLLDAIRQTKFLLTEAEAGGITQHIGAYHVEVPHEDGTLRQIVFLDTPGHEAFTAMRARGAKATDIAILVVAADDGVMPQTIEAIDHAKAAGVPIIVAVNKVDKQGADPDHVLSQLMEHELLPEKFGGDTVTVNVSAKKRTGLDELLEMILLVAEILDLKANPDKAASGVIIEAELSRGKGAVATALIENGTLREGDLIVAGSKSGRVRALFDDHGQRVKAAGPSMPVEVLGLDEVPQAGDRFEVVADIQTSKMLVEQRRLETGERRMQHVTLESLHDLLERGEVKELNAIVKADVQGTAEAIAEQIKKLSGLEVQVRVLRIASGDISENDVNLAASSNAIILGFNVQPDQNAKQVAEAEGVDIRTYNVIYQITDDIEKAVQGLIQPLRTEVQIGTAEVRQVFKFGKNLTIAGCMVTNGKIQRTSIAHITRDGKLVYEGKVETLKRFKDDAREVAQGFECGMSFEKFADLQEGDLITAFVIQETKREITRAS